MVWPGKWHDKTPGSISKVFGSKVLDNGMFKCKLRQGLLLNFSKLMEYVISCEDGNMVSNNMVDTSVRLHTTSKNPTKLRLECYWRGSRWPRPPALHQDISKYIYAQQEIHLAQVRICQREMSGNSSSGPVQWVEGVSHMSCEEQQWQ